MSTKRFKKAFSLIILFLLTLLLPAAFLSPDCYAREYDSYDYYIRDFHVDVNVNKDRSYDVTETITVWFNNEARGIFRDIQTVSSVERYRVENINVIGEPFVIDVKSDYIHVRIGDPDIYISGEKTYTISYTRIHYDDGEPDFDYFYMDLIGDRWSAPITNFSAMVRLPEDAVVNKFTITSGSTGSTGNDYAQGEISGNVIDIRMKNPLEPFMAVTLNVEMLQGAFPDAVAYAPPIVFHSIDVSAELDGYGIMTVAEVYDATINEAVSIRHPASSTYGATALSWTEPNGKQSYYATFYPDFFVKYVGQRVQFSFTYQVKFPITEFTGSFRFSIDLLSTRDDEILVEKYLISVTSPFELTDVSFRDGFNARDADALVLKLSDDGKKLNIEADADVGVNYTDVTFYSSGFKRAVTAGDFMIPLITVAVAFLVFIFAFVYKPEKKLVAPIAFYPPDDMDPAAMGYVIDGNISGRDVTSLIYYWASHGHLTIEITDNSGSFILHKKSELDPAHKSYEIEMYGKLWALGEENKVTNSNLEEEFYTTVHTTATAVRKSFTGGQALDKGKYRSWLGVFFMMTGCFAMFYAFSSLWSYTESRTLTTGIFAALLYLVISVLISQYHKRRYKNPKSNKVLLAVSIALFLVFALLVFTTAAGTSQTIAGVFVIIVSLAVAFYSVPLLRRKTDFGIEQLDRNLGFRTFLMTAEKSRLEMLLEDNPDYYYNILPYAQILGVTKIWEKKFDGLLSQPPTWCYGEGIDDTIMTTGLINVTNSLSRSMTSSPSSDGGGGSSDGGGSYSGGGSSGGGGGGGGGTW